MVSMRQVKDSMRAKDALRRWEVVCAVHKAYKPECLPNNSITTNYLLVMKHDYCTQGPITCIYWINNVKWSCIIYTENKTREFCLVVCVKSLIHVMNGKIIYGGSSSSCWIKQGVRVGESTCRQFLLTDSRPITRYCISNWSNTWTLICLPVDVPPVSHCVLQCKQVYIKSLCNVCCVTVSQIMSVKEESNKTKQNGYNLSQKNQLKITELNNVLRQYILSVSWELRRQLHAVLSKKQCYYLQTCYWLSYWPLTSANIKQQTLPLQSTKKLWLFTLPT